MFLLEALASLALLAFVISLVCWVGLAAMLGAIEFYGVLKYPFECLRNKLDGGHPFAPKGQIFLAAFISKSLAALIAGGIAVYLGASIKATAIAAVLAFLFIG